MNDAGAKDEGWHVVAHQPAVEIREERQIEQWEKANGHWSGIGKHPTNWSEHKAIRVLDRELGVGSYGTVERVAYKTVTMARKVVRPRPGMTVEKLREEANAMERLVHRHILKLVGTYTLKNKSLYLLLHPVAVCDLSRFLEDVDDIRSGHCADREDAFKRLRLLGIKNVGTIEDLAVSRPHIQTISASSTTITAVGFLQQILGCLTEALAYVHETGIRHCDLKTKNILLSPGRVYLADFGIARDVKESEDSITSGRCGTPSWMAPEVHDEEAHHMSPADIWPLGCIFLNVATVIYGEMLDKYDSIMKERNWTKKYQLLPAYLDYLRSKAAIAHFEDPGAPNFNLKHIVDLIDDMLKFKPEERPTAVEVNARLSEYGGLDQIYHLSCCHKPNSHVSTIINDKFESVYNANAASLVEIARLKAEHEKMQERLGYLEMVHGTYEKRIENERKHAGEQYKALKDKYDQEMRTRKDLEDCLKATEIRHPRQPRPQYRGRGKSQGEPRGPWTNNKKSNVVVNQANSPPLGLDTESGSFQRRRSFLPLPSRPSTPLSTPVRPSPNRDPGSSTSTLVSSTYSTFSRASMETNESTSSTASSIVRSVSPTSPTTIRPPASPIIAKVKAPFENEKSNQSGRTSWANMVARSASKK